MISIDTPTRVIVLRYDLGEVVYHKLAPQRIMGMITGISIQPDGCSYHVTWPDHQEQRHYEIELSTEYVPDYESGE